MTFDSVHHMLLWFFNKLWIKPPKEPGNHDPVYIQGNVIQYDARDVWDTVLRISKVIDRLPARDRGLIQSLFTDNIHISDVARRMQLTERRLRQIRATTLSIIRSRCIKAGIVCKARYTDPVYLKGE